MAKSNKYQQESNIKTIVEATAETVFDRKYGSIKEENKALKWLMGAVILVLFIGFITILVTIIDIVVDNSNSVTQGKVIQGDLGEIKREIRDLKLKLR